jgi:hypothetical protein
MRPNNVSELLPPSVLMFIPQVIYEHVEPWWNDIDREKIPHSSTRALWQSYQQSNLVAIRKNGRREFKFCLVKYFWFIFASVFFYMP